MLERIEINLLPAEYRIHRRAIRLQREIVWPLVGLVVAGCVVGLLQVGVDAEIGQLRRSIADIEQRIQQNRHIKGEIDQLQAVHTTILEKIKALERISVNKEKWVRLLEILCAYMPSYTWISNVGEQAGTTAESALRIVGSTFSFPEVASFMSRLTESEYISTVDLSGIEQGGGDVRYPVYNFTLTAAINPDAGLRKEHGRPRGPAPQQPQ